MYSANCLEWHLGDESCQQTPIGICAVLSYSKRVFWTTFNRLAVALAKSQDRRNSYGVLSFGRSDAVRRWSDLRYPVTRASQSRGRGRIPRARWLKESGVVRSDDMAPYSMNRSTERTLILITVRLCFAPTSTISI